MANGKNNIAAVSNNAINSGQSYSEKAQAVVAAVIHEVGMKDPVALRRALHDAYPFGERKAWPYKAWLAEIQKQIGGMRPKKADPRQMRLFD